MTRLESGVVEPAREWVPLEELVGVALARVEHALAGREIRNELPSDLPLLFVDPLLIEQLLVNLLENAARYTPPGSAIEIRAARRESRLEIEVADHGPGLPPGDEDRVFERFQRGSHANGPGAGLGLAICRAIAGAHRGTLTARNREGGGATFRLLLPLVEPPEPAGDP